MFTPPTVSLSEVDPHEHVGVFESLDAMFELCPAEELVEYAGLAEHPNETVRRLSASGMWDGPGGAREHIDTELGFHLRSGDSRRPANARRLAYELVQQVPRWKPPENAISVPTIFEQRGRCDEVEQQRQRELIDRQKSELRSASGCRPPNQTAEVKAYFRNLDVGFATGKRHQDLLAEIVWIYEHIVDDDLTASMLRVAGPGHSCISPGRTRASS